MNKKILFILVLCLLLFTGCTRKEKVNWEEKYYELQEEYIDDMFENYASYRDALEKINQLENEVKYLKEPIDTRVKLETLKVREDMRERYLETFHTIFENANKELIKYGLYLGYDGNIYVKE